MNDDVILIMYDRTKQKLVDNDEPREIVSIPSRWDRPDYREDFERQAWRSGFFTAVILFAGCLAWRYICQPTKQPPVASGPPGVAIESGPGKAPISLDAVDPTRPPPGVAPDPHDEPQIDAQRGKLPALPKEWK